MLPCYFPSIAFFSVKESQEAENIISAECNKKKLFNTAQQKNNKIVGLVASVSTFGFSSKFVSNFILFCFLFSFSVVAFPVVVVAR